MSTTQLLHNLSTALEFNPGDELILSKLNHEANSAAWLRIAQRLGLQVKWWAAADAKNPVCDLGELKSLLSEKTRIVACPHASNITGTITDIKTIAGLVHQYPRVGYAFVLYFCMLICFKALLCVDGVALAPHRQLDVKDLDVDFYVSSSIQKADMGLKKAGFLVVQGLRTSHRATIRLIPGPQPDQQPWTFLQRN